MSWAYRPAGYKEDIPVKFPDGSQLYFLGFGYLKQIVFLIRAKFLQGVYKSYQDVWSESYMNKDLILRVFDSWKIRQPTIAA
jgi:hypothetical protein